MRLRRSSSAEPRERTGTPQCSMDLRSPAQNVKKGPAHYRRSRAIRCLLSVPLLCRLGSTALGEEDLQDGVSAPALGSQALRPSVLLRLSGTRHRSQVGWRGLNSSNLGAPASRPASAARGPMKRLRLRRDPAAHYCISVRRNGLEVDEVAACGLPVAVTMPWQRHPSCRSRKHSHVCDVQHSIRPVTPVGSLRLSGSGTAAKEHCLARVRPRQCLSAACA